MSPYSGIQYAALPPDPGGVASIDVQNNMRTDSALLRSVGIADLAHMTDRMSFASKSLSLESMWRTN
jgi:hypothetical protein